MKTVIQLSALALIIALGVSTDFLMRLYPPESFGTAFAAEPHEIDFASARNVV